MIRVGIDVGGTHTDLIALDSQPAAYIVDLNEKLKGIGFRGTLEISV